MSLAFVDDHPVILAGMSSMFSEDKKFIVVGKGGSADEARALAVTLQPEILFMDLSMPGDVLAAIGFITANVPATRIIVLTAFSSVDSALRALEAGAMGFVLKGNSFDDLFEAIETVLRGELYVSKQYFGQVMNALRTKGQRNGLSRSIKLSIREKQILGYLMVARTNREIALSLKISEQTVKNYMSGLMAKLSARNRVEVIFAAQRNAADDYEQVRLTIAARPDDLKAM